ncbi:MAG TPA: nitroreductase family protein, partial [Rubricoccaceae bacterium]
MNRAPDSPWALPEEEFPGLINDAERLRFLVRYAVLAPSARNTQPWRFHVAGNTLELWADRTRGLPVVDPAGRELTISCGAALYHLRL